MRSERGCYPALNKYQPELLIVSAGFDSRAGDPLGQLLLTDEDFADLTDLLLDFATRCMRGPLGVRSRGRI